MPRTRRFNRGEIRDSGRGFDRNRISSSLTKSQRMELDKINTKQTINNKTYDVESFHPLAFQKGVYTVRFHESGKPYTDEYSRSTMVKASDSREAIGLARKEYFNN